MSGKICQSPRWEVYLKAKVESSPYADQLFSWSALFSSYLRRDCFLCTTWPADSPHSCSLSHHCHWWDSPQLYHPHRRMSTHPCGATVLTLLCLMWYCWPQLSVVSKWKSPAASCRERCAHPAGPACVSNVGGRLYCSQWTALSITSLWYPGEWGPSEEQLKLHHWSICLNDSMCCMTSLLKHFMMTRVSATGQKSL